MTSTVSSTRRAAAGLRRICGVATPGDGLRLIARTDPAHRVWARRFFRYAFDPNREIPADDPASASQARAAIRRAMNTWASAGVGITFIEVDVDAAPDVVFEWVPREHSAADGEHESLAADGTDNPIAHADFPPRLDRDEVTRFVCFDQEDLDWDLLVDADGDGLVDVSPTGPGDIETVALHELGHFLGLDHLAGPANVMYEASNGQRVPQPADLDALRALYPPQGPVRFNAIWAVGSVERKALAWPPEDGTVHPGVPADELADAMSVAEGDGWQPSRINAYEVPEGRFYNVVLDRTTDDRRWMAGHDEADFRDRHEANEADGYSLLSIDSYRNGERWNAVWTRDGSDSSLLRITGNAEFATATLGDLSGVRPTSITAYVDPDGVQHWAVVLWTNPVRTRVRLGLTRDQMRGVTDAMLEDGFYPFDINTFVLPDGGGERWNGIYVRQPFTFSNFRARGQYDAPNQITRYESKDLDAFNLNAFVRPAPLAGAQVTAHEVSHPASAPGTSVVTMGVAVDDTRVYATRYVQHPSNGNDEPDGTLVVLDRATMAERAITTVGHRPRRVAVNPTTGRIYVVNWGQRSYSVSVVDGTTLEVVTTLPMGQAPGPIAVNPRTNRVYVTSWFQGLVHVIDGATDELLDPIALGGAGPMGITVDPERDDVYVTVINRSFAPFRNGIARFTDRGGSTTPALEPFVALEPLATQSQDVVADPSRDRVYIANLGGGGEHPSMFVLDRPSLDVLAKVDVPGPVRAIAVNPDADEVYGAGDRGTVVLDATTNTFVGQLDARASWGIAAADGTARQLFLAERNGSITRVHG